MAIKSPYNFVPINNEIFTNPSDRYDLLQYCQDVPFKDAIMIKFISFLLPQ